MFELPTVDYPTDSHSDLPEGFSPASLRRRELTSRSIVDDRQSRVRVRRRPVTGLGRRGHGPVSPLRASAFDPARDVTIAEIDGEPVGFAERGWVDTTDGTFREYRCDGAVLPEWRRRGIGTALLAENISVNRASSPPRIRPTASERSAAGRSDRKPGANALMRNSGFEQVRWFFEMTRDPGRADPRRPDCPTVSRSGR